MNHAIKKYHPAMMIVELVTFIKGIFGPFLLLFVLKASSTSTWVVWGRYLLLAGSLGAIVWIILKWHFHRYEISGNTIVLREGIFVKKQRSVSFDRIQNQKSNTTFVHQWFGLTSLTLETSITGEDASFHFPVITEQEKERILKCLEQHQNVTNLRTEDQPAAETTPLRTIHFRSTKRDLVKASFTSLSFLAIFPLLSAIYFNLADFFQIEKTAKNALEYLLMNSWMLASLFVLAMLISVVIGFIKTSVKYGNFVISDDQERIYIEKGVGNVIRFSIQKNKIQAVMIEQSILKRLLGLASIKLLSAGGSKEDHQETGYLYPFMPKHEAYKMLQTILPQYQIEEHMERFPLKVLWLKLLHPYYVTILALMGLFIFKSEWLWMTAVIFLFSVGARILDYHFTSYIRFGDTIQIRKGGFTTKTFVTHRDMIQQITVKHSWLQRRFGVATLVFTNKAKPQHESKLYGVSSEEASFFYTWYQRKSASL
jgi:putative membrane protein